MRDDSIGLPDMIPDDLPDEILMIVLMVSPALMYGVDRDNVPPELTHGPADGVLAAGMQVQLNCPLAMAVEGLRGLLASMERDLKRRRVAGSN